MSDKITAKTTIWDLPTRVFHWLFVASFVIAWLTYDDNRFLYFHVYGGYLFLGLLLFRLLWGLVGTYYARFRSFAADWHSVRSYLAGLLNGSASRHIGHNPIGSWAIFLMLLLSLLVSATGLLVFGGEENHGPLRGLVSFSVGMTAHEVHEFLAWTLLAVVTVHLAGVLVESYIHKDNLIWAMISGHKDSTAGSTGVRGHHLLGSLMLVLITGSAIYYFSGYLTETADHLYQPYKGPDLPDNAEWREVCGECHLAFHPTLLPRRSWKVLFEQQHKHFGDDLDLDQDSYDSLLKFHLDNAAETGLSEPANKVNYYEPANSAPIQITRTKYWTHKHEEIKEGYWKTKKVRTKSNCGACHLDAKQGTFEDSDMRLPALDKTP